MVIGRETLSGEVSASLIGVIQSQRQPLFSMLLRTVILGHNDAFATAEIPVRLPK